MADTIEKIGNSVIQHGSFNDRIYLMKCRKADYPDIIEKLFKIASKNSYTKIFAKVPEWAVEGFRKAGFVKEAFIPKFYSGKTDVFFYSNFLSKERRRLTETRKEKIQKNIALAKEKGKKPFKQKAAPLFTLRRLDERDILQLTSVYEAVFDTYPFPIFKDNYIRKTMRENVVYFGAFKGETLIAASSAEMDVENRNAEMTDFATRPDYRGHSTASLLLDLMEAEMRERGINTLYTIARSHSAGMNITFAKKNYIYSGTLINNTNISGRIESMNVWYKLFW